MGVDLEHDALKRVATHVFFAWLVSVVLFFVYDECSSHLTWLMCCTTVPSFAMSVATIPKLLNTSTSTESL